MSVSGDIRPFLLNYYLTARRAAFCFPPYLKQIDSNPKNNTMLLRRLGVIDSKSAIKIFNSNDIIRANMLTIHDIIWQNGDIILPNHQLGQIDSDRKISLKSLREYDGHDSEYNVQMVIDDPLMTSSMTSSYIFLAKTLFFKMIDKYERWWSNTPQYVTDDVIDDVTVIVNSHKYQKSSILTRLRSWLGQIELGINQPSHHTIADIMMTSSYQCWNNSANIAPNRKLSEVYIGNMASTITLGVSMTSLLTSWWHHHRKI